MIFDRATFEKKLASSIGSRLNGQLPKLMDFLGDPPDPANVPASFWDALGVNLTADIKPQLAQAYAESAVNLGNEIHNTYQIEVTGAVNWTLVNKQAAAWAKTHAGELIKGLNDTSRDRLQAAISNFFEKQKTMGDLRNELSAIFGPERAALIATTEITNASNYGELDTVHFIEDNSKIQMVGIWHTDADEFVCDICGSLDGQEEDGRDSDGEPYWICSFDGEAYSIGAAHPRCILPGNMIVPPGIVRMATKALYHGRCIEIGFSNGRSLSVTENHPVLTWHGWVPAKLICEDDDVIGTSDPERIASAINPNNDHRPTEIEEIFGSLEKSGDMSTVVMPSSPIDFYGDGRYIDGKIDIVDVDSFLWSCRNPKAAQPGTKVNFSRRNISTARLERQSMTDFEIIGKHLPAHSRVGSSALIEPLLLGHVRPFQGLGLRATAERNPGKDHMLAEGGPTDTHLASEFIWRFASNITSNQVIKVRDFDFSGHVYDLQVDPYGIIICNGIITHNCRCKKGWSPKGW